jgi:hypothetical protein
VAAILKRTRTRLRLLKDNPSDEFFKRKLKAFEPLSTFINAKHYVERFNPFNKSQSKLDLTNASVSNIEVKRDINLKNLRLTYTSLEHKPLESNEYYKRKKDEISDGS